MSYLSLPPPHPTVDQVVVTRVGLLGQPEKGFVVLYLCAFRSLRWITLYSGDLVF